MSTCAWCRFCDVEIRDNPFLCPFCAARAWPRLPPEPPRTPKPEKKRKSKWAKQARRKAKAKAKIAAELHERLVATAAEVFPRSKIVRERKRHVSSDRR